MVTAFAVEAGLSLAQRPVAEKSNEITAIPFLLEMLALAECVVTIDAMGCQTEIADQIIEHKGDYILSLKGNQGQLHEDTQQMFSYLEKTGFADVPTVIIVRSTKDMDDWKFVNAGRFRPTCWPSTFAPWISGGG